MNYQGTLSKMQTEIGSPIQYYLVFENSFLNVNQLLGKDIEIEFQIIASKESIKNPKFQYNIGIWDFSF